MKVVKILLFKPFNKYFSALLAFFSGLFFIKGVAAKSQVPHDSVIDVKEVKHGTDDHENGDEVNNFIRNGDIAQELLELRALNRGQLKVVVT